MQKFKLKFYRLSAFCLVACLGCKQRRHINDAAKIKYSAYRVQCFFASNSILFPENKTVKFQGGGVEKKCRNQSLPRVPFSETIFFYERERERERERAKRDACLPDGRLCKRQSDSRHQLPIDSSQLSFTRLHSPPPFLPLFSVSSLKNMGNIFSSKRTVLFY